MRYAGHVSLYACLFGALSCGEELRPATQIVVLVGGDPSLDSLNVLVQSEKGRNISDERVIELGTEGLPTSFTIVPAESPAELVRIVVLGRKGNAKAEVTRTVKARFTEGKTTLLPIVLSAQCAGRCQVLGTASGESEAFMECDPEDGCEQTCVPSGGGAACVSVDEHAPLAEIEPGDELSELAAGLGECKAGEMPNYKGACLDLDECAFGLHECVEPSVCKNELAGRLPYRCE